MLTPHHRKDSELGKIRFAAENFLDSLEFFRGETVFRHQLRSYFWIGGRFSAGHRQRTLTEAERDSTRLRTPASRLRSLLWWIEQSLVRRRTDSSRGELDVKIMSAKPSSSNIARGAPKAFASRQADPPCSMPRGRSAPGWHLGTSPLRLPRRSLAKAGSRKGQG